MATTNTYEIKIISSRIIKKEDLRIKLVHRRLLMLSPVMASILSDINKAEETDVLEFVFKNGKEVNKIAQLVHSQNKRLKKIYPSSKMPLDVYRQGTKLYVVKGFVGDCIMPDVIVR